MQTLKTTGSGIVFQLTLRSLKGNILINFIVLLRNLWDNTSIYIDTRLIITLVMVKLISLLYQKLFNLNRIINKPLNRSNG